MAHLRKKGDKKWQIVLNVGIDPRTGRKKRKTKVVNCSETKAKKIMHKLAAKHENDVYSGEIDITLGEYLKRWLNEIAKNEVAQNTFRDYNGVIKNHIIPALGNLKINQLKPHHMIKYQNEKLNNGRLRGKGGLSKRTVENHHRILSKALSDAVVIYQFLENNPIRDVKAPTPEDTEIKPFSEKDIQEILDNIKEFYFYALVYVDYETGLRRSEILALKWKDIDLEENSIQIQRAVKEIRVKGLVYEEPKNSSSYRSIYIDDNVVKILKKIKKDHLKINHEDNLVFTFPGGKKIRPDYITKKFKDLLDKLNLGEHRFHDLRHTHATELLQAGVNPKIVQERLGHAKIETTLNVYSHVIPSMQKDAIQALKKFRKNRENENQNANIPHIKN